MTAGLSARARRPRRKLRAGTTPNPDTADPIQPGRVFAGVVEVDRRCLYTCGKEAVGRR